jgi:hypothetical protein
MHTQDTSKHDASSISSGRAKWAFIAFAAIGAFFLLSEHRAHVLAYLPWLILLACPLMHVFMHGKHGGHGGHDHAPRQDSATVDEAGASGNWDTRRAPEDHSQHGSQS